MQLISVNIGHERTLQVGNKIETTGIYKLPTNEAVEIETLGIKSDFIASKKHHGGPDQAVYIYGAADYEWWSQLGRELPPGTFGENLTISRLESAQFNIGDRLLIGTAILEVTAPRIPCGTFAARMGDPQFVKRFREAERPGLYCRILKEGSVKAGDDVHLKKRNANETISLLQVFRDYYNKNKSEEAIRQHLNAPIAIRVRIQLEEELRRLSERQ
ncbi:MAG: MOSC domain-containing protein [Chloroflexi bacterium]|nr:MOSC domain-containing protein [Chloroflexota bacterium]